MTQTRTDHWAKMKHTATNFVVKMPEAVVITKRELLSFANISRTPGICRFRDTQAPYVGEKRNPIYQLE